MGDIESVAYFKVAMQGVTLVSLGLSAINMVIMPNVARLYKEGNLEATQILLTKSVRLSCLVSLPIIFILVFFGDFFINILFGSEYLEAYPILVILCIGQAMKLLMGSTGLVLNMTGNEKLALKTVSITVSINVILLTMLIPYYGLVGAAISISLSLFINNFLMGTHVWRITTLTTWLSFKV
ncbi:polysaccharide biosynthesis C-terminal domain-containing protein [Psychromonas sp. KJ10-2]|uniref:oligosaccharide flippase family protein n=1 Tax=Psychromonas sp. KJ10-2 TaxID=3391822 RepID=UPI0039B4054D